MSFYVIFQSYAILKIIKEITNVACMKKRDLYSNCSKWLLCFGNWN